MACTTTTTWVTTPNIAVVKYWGKRDTKAMAPLNSSLSIALHADTLRTFSTASLVPQQDGASDELEMNGARVEHDSPSYARFARCLERLRTRLPVSSPKKSMFVHVRSRNSFPTGAGVASSASGLAGVAVAAAHALGIDAKDPVVAHAARMGSGSACRSCLGGFVLWSCDPEVNLGTANVPSGEHEEQACIKSVADASMWPDLRLAVLLASVHEKRVGSTAGMQLTVATSGFLKYRVEHVPEYIDATSKAITSHDFAALATCAMRDSNQLHAVCLDSFPPLAYMTDVGHAACALIHAINEVAGSVIVGYTFDAGPNPVLLASAADMPLVLRLFARFFPGMPSAKQQDTASSEHEETLLSEEGLAKIVAAAGFEKWHECAFKSVLVSAVGTGPFAVSGDVSEADDVLLSRPHIQ